MTPNYQDGADRKQFVVQDKVQDLVSGGQVGVKRATAKEMNLAPRQNALTDLCPSVISAQVWCLTIYDALHKAKET